MLLLLALGSGKLAAGTLSIGGLVALILYVEGLVFPTALLGFSLNTFQIGQVSLERVEELLQRVPLIRDNTVKTTRRNRNGEELAGRLEARNLHVRYEGADRDTLAGVTFSIEPGELVAVVGPVGCGKTSLMKLLRYIIPGKPTYEMIPSRNVVFSFNHLGFKTVEEYGDSGSYCFDDLGLEPYGRFYGKDANVMGEVLLSRYELYRTTRGRLKTHITTNLNATELEERYGNRVRSRMRELFNLITFDQNSQDKRFYLK